MSTALPTDETVDSEAADSADNDCLNGDGAPLMTDKRRKDMDGRTPE